MLPAYNPWESIRTGQMAADSQMAAILQRRQIEDILAEREAMALQGPNFIGYPDVPAPAWLQQLRKTGSPEAALRWEQLAAAPYTEQRQIELAGGIEAAKKQADYAAIKNYLTEFLQVPEAQATVQASEAVAPETEEGVSAPPVALGGLPAVERTFEVGPQGPKVTMKQMSPFERGLAMDKQEMERKTHQLHVGKEHREAVDSETGHIRQIRTQIQAVQKQMEMREIPRGQGLEQLKDLQEELRDHQAARESLLRRGSRTPEAPKRVPDRTSSPVQKPVEREAPQELSEAPPPPSTRVAAAAPVPAVEGPAPTERERAEIAQKQRESVIATEKEKREIGNKEIANARVDAMHLQGFNRPIQELYDLVTKHEVGSPVISRLGLPWAAPEAGTTYLLSKPINAQVKNLSEQLTNAFAKPGQSQLMNTIVERMMQAAMVPNIANDPNQNRKNITVLRSNFDNLQQLPSFLESWAKAHQGNLEGATEAWLGYADNNPTYIYSESKNGKVTTRENPAYRPWKSWMEGIRKGTIKQVGGRWVEKE